jgi:hypothetical protein
MSLTAALSTVFLDTHPDIRDLLKAHDEGIQYFVGNLDTEDIEAEGEKLEEQDDISDKTFLERFKRIYEGNGCTLLPVEKANNEAII